MGIKEKQVIVGKWKKVLLAIDGTSPDNRVLQYALELCREISADLAVLQILRKKSAETGHTGSPPKADGDLTAPARCDNASDYYIPESDCGGALNSVLVKQGNPEQEIARYVETHGDVVITVDDTGPSSRNEDGAPGKSHTSRWHGSLAVPRVFVRKKRSKP